jgi:hypothetical protein
MGYVRGSTLAEAIADRGPVERRGITDFYRARGGNSRPRASGRRHPSRHQAVDILIDAESGRAILADFGIAKIVNADDRLTAGNGHRNPNFMSPEQAAGEGDVDARSDLYSLGAVAYAMLSGREPFHGTAFPRRTTSAPPDPRRWLRTFRPLCAAVVMRCLARDPHNAGPAHARSSTRLPSWTKERRAGSVGGTRASAFGPYALLWAALWLARRSPYRSIGDRIARADLADRSRRLFLHAWNVAGGGLPPSQIARVAFWPPEWWGAAAHLRQPSDLWKRARARASCGAH